jgi:hypothetical protein
MRNTNAQCANIMVRPAVSQQPPKPHVSHAEIGGCDARSAAIATSALASFWIRKEHESKIPVIFSSEILPKRPASQG